VDSGRKARAGESSPAKLVWIIGAWDLVIVCYLLFGAWNLLDLSTPFYLDTQKF
jgi:hypothetical protein